MIVQGGLIEMKVAQVQDCRDDFEDLFLLDLGNLQQSERIIQICPHYLVLIADYV